MVKPRKKFYFRKDFRNMTKPEIVELLEKEVFGLDTFKNQVKEVTFKTKIHEDIVTDILRSYFINILVAINTVRKFKTKINIYAFLSLKIKEGKRY